MGDVFWTLQGRERTATGKDNITEDRKKYDAQFYFSLMTDDFIGGGCHSFWGTAIAGPLGSSKRSMVRSWMIM